MNSNNSQCHCASTASPKLVFACSGAADVGETADRAARLLSQQGIAKMYCLAGLGGQVPAILKTTQSAASILAIDGCPVECAKRTLELAGFPSFKHLKLRDLGLEKGSCPATDENIGKVARRAKELIQ